MTNSCSASTFPIMGLQRKRNDLLISGNFKDLLSFDRDVQKRMKKVRVNAL